MSALIQLAVESTGYWYRQIGEVWLLGESVNGQPTLLFLFILMGVITLFAQQRGIRLGIKVVDQFQTVNSSP